MNDLSFIRAKAEDHDELLELMQEFYVFEQITFDRAVVRTVLTELTGSDTYGQIFLITSQGKIIGYLLMSLCYSAEFGGRFLLLDELYLREEYRGKGVGKYTMAFAEETGKRLGVQSIRLEVSHENTKALTLYKKVGFSSHGRDFLTKKISDEKPIS